MNQPWLQNGPTRHLYTLPLSAPRGETGCSSPLALPSLATNPNHKGAGYLIGYFDYYDEITIYYDYINMFLYLEHPRAQISSVFEGQPLKTRPFPIKTRFIWVPCI